MTEFQVGLVVGVFIGAACFPAVLFLLVEGAALVRRRREPVRRKQAEQNRRLRLVLGSAVRTPGPYAKLKSKELA